MFNIANKRKPGRSSIVGKGNFGGIGCGAAGVSRKLVVDGDSIGEDTLRSRFKLKFIGRYGKDNFVACTSSNEIEVG